ncbi:MAG: homoserine dehydrogenase [Clostridioides sp.]|jgi:homoserine dehydrogenase|nr:homoserine dehydrogenase [Clostridioides sp.]
MAEKLKIGLLGLGTVGSGVPLILEEHKEKISQITGMDIEISKALVRNEERMAYHAGRFNFELVDDFDEILNDDEIQIVVELIGKIEPAKSYISKALENGKHVVTANKDLLAQYGSKLVSLAQGNHVDLYFEGSVAGGIPILRTIANSLAADSIQKVYGIVNGTTNYMLTQMISESKSYDDALKEAQELGFAESDPTNDVDGIDAAYKMVILSQFAFGMNITVDQVEIKGIRDISVDDVKMAQNLGYEIKLIGSSELCDDSISVEVSPMFIPKTHPLATVRNESNAVYINSQGVGNSMYYGPGAGAKPTATSVVSDIITIAKNIKMGTVGHRFNAFKFQTKITKDNSVFSKYYFSVELPDVYGQMLQLAKIFTESGVSFEQIVQHKSEKENARIIIITHSASKCQIKRVVYELSNTDGFKVLSQYKVFGE